MLRAKAGEGALKGCLIVGASLALFIPLALYSAWPRPIEDPAVLKAVARESDLLLSSYRRVRAERSVSIPRNGWPPAIASLEPRSVTIHYDMVDISTKPGLDGGWGYGFARDKQKLAMLPECWSHLGYGMYWHGPC